MKKLHRTRKGQEVEAVYIRDRVRLWEFRQQHREWTQRQLAEAIGRSLGWVKKWLRRFHEQPPESNPQVFFSRSTVPEERERKVKPEVIQRILDIRDNPPEKLQRIPGPDTILYYLHRQTDLQDAGYYLPTSSRTIWQILVAHGRIARPAPCEHQPVERPIPDGVWAIDYKDISTVPGDPSGIDKKRHAVEALNIVDEGTSRLIDTQVRSDFTAETTLVAIASTLLLKGMPQTMKMDRDTRFIGSWSAKDFPSPLMRFLMCLGIQVQIVPPQRPDKNPFVERFHRAVQEEVLQVFRPGSLDQAIERMETFYHHYNHERPNQALSCGNQPPHDAFPNLPALPTPPETVDPDTWLIQIDRKAYTRRVNSHGSIQIGDNRYYVSKTLAGQRVTLIVHAHKHEFAVYHGKLYLRQLPIKGLLETEISFSDFLRLICEQARTVDRRLHYRSRRTKRSRSK
jgi:hypothetical protein